MVKCTAKDGMPLSVFDMIDSVMTRLCTGALWQVAAGRLRDPPLRLCCAFWLNPVKSGSGEDVAMNGNIQVIRATEVSKHTGIVWGATFPYPGAKFLDDMAWRAFDAAGRSVEWEAYGMRARTLVGGKLILEMRFRDRSWTPLREGADVTVELVSPMP